MTNVMIGHSARGYFQKQLSHQTISFYVLVEAHTNWVINERIREC